VNKHLRRLERVWIDFPIYYITTCVRNRKYVLAQDEAAQILVEEWRAARCRHGWGRAKLDAKSLSDFVGNWKSWTSRAINALGRPRSAPAATTLWQREFFDHVVRSNESYAEKWNYVQENPVRAGLVKSADHWSYSGEIEILML
jgi:REP element-mobilizing transposase RayT